MNPFLMLFRAIYQRTEIVITRERPSGSTSCFLRFPISDKKIFMNGKILQEGKRVIAFWVDYFSKTVSILS